MGALPMTDAPPILTLERPEHASAVEALIDAAFGPGRHAKSAERLREGNAPDLTLSMVALEGEVVVGCSRIWPIHIGDTRALLLGPFAVSHERRRQGLGAILIERCCQAAQAAGHGLVMLVGDAPYFGKLGFEAVDAKVVVLPGPVSARRVLVRALQPGAADGLAGPVTAG